MAKQCRKGACVMNNSDKQLKYAILHLRSEGMSDEDISKELGATTKKIKSLLKTDLVKKTEKDPIKTTSSKVNSKDLMITKTESKKINSVAIMTKAASEINDEFRKNLGETVSRTGKSSIFRPKNK